MTNDKQIKPKWIGCASCEINISIFQEIIRVIKMLEKYQVKREKMNFYPPEHMNEKVTYFK